MNLEEFLGANVKEKLIHYYLFIMTKVVSLIVFGERKIINLQMIIIKKYLVL
jgi:hypothetical protein